MMTVNQLVQQARTLSSRERVELLKQLIDLVAEPTPSVQRHSILEFEGIAAHLSDDKDPQEAMKRLRSEWDERA